MNILGTLNSLAKHRRKQIDKILNLYFEKYGNFTIAETGTIRNTSFLYKIGDGHSTKTITRFIKKNPGCKFYSIDLNTSVCDTYLSKKGLRKYVELIEGNSLDVLPTLDFDVAYLDSDNDAELIFKEFMIAKEKAKLIIIDDVDPENPELQKGVNVMKYLDENNLEYDLLPRQLMFWNKDII
jgi:hypothetical protein